MAKCWKCGKKGIFLKTNAQGLCQSCADLVRQQEDRRRKREALEEEQRLRKKRDLDNFRVNRFPVHPVLDTIVKEWTYWNTDKHDSPDQVVRQKRALQQAIPISINSHINSGYFISSSWDKIYSTDLISCTCKDFCERNLPCKHIYRLFWELNYNHCIDISQVLNVSHDLLNRFFQMDIHQQVDFISHARFRTQKEFQVTMSDSVKSAVEAGLYVVTDHVDYSNALSKLTKDEIILSLAKSSIQGYKPSWSKVKLIDWVCETQQAFLKKQFKKLVTVMYSDEAASWIEGINSSAKKYSPVLTMDF